MEQNGSLGIGMETRNKWKIYKRIISKMEKYVLMSLIEDLKEENLKSTEKNQWFENRAKESIQFWETIKVNWKSEEHLTVGQYKVV